MARDRPAVATNPLLPYSECRCESGAPARQRPPRHDGNTSFPKVSLITSDDMWFNDVANWPSTLEVHVD